MKKTLTNILVALSAVATVLTFTGCTDTDSYTAPETTHVSETTVADTTEATALTTIATVAQETAVATEAPTTQVTANRTTTATTAVDTSVDSTMIDATCNRLQYHPYVEAINPNRTLHLNNARGKYLTSDIKTWYFYDLGNACALGIGKNGEPVRTACYKGFVATIENNRDLTIKASNDCDVVIEFETNDVTPKYNVRKDGNLIIASADLWDNTYVNGIYNITCTLDGNDISVYLYVNCASDNVEDFHFYLCYGEEHYFSEEFSPIARRDYLNNLLNNEGVTPENALNNRNYNYPCMSNSTNDDVQYWIDKSHEILGNKTYKNSTKALLLHDWMTSNLKYDYYKVNVLVTPRYYVNYVLNPSEYVSQNYTGVCLDFSSIYAIMCRENGIPCVVLNNDAHAWNAIYIGGRWYEVDLTRDTNRLVYGEDTNKVTGATNYYCYEGFCMPNVNDDTPMFATRFCW